MNTSNDLAAALARTDYEELFERQSPTRRREILARPGALAEARALVRDAGAPAPSRFLAAELAFVSDPAFPPADEVAPLVALYAEALEAAESGDRWAMPGHWVGQAGKHLVRLGAPALAGLRPLLGDGRRVRYSGSHRATLGEHYQVRIKDVAEYLASRILGVHYEILADPAARDAVPFEIP